MESVVDESYRNVMKASRNISDEQVKLKEVSEDIKKQIGNFRKQLPLLNLLRNPGLRKRHWLKISKETGVDLHRLRYINGIELKQYGSKQEQEEEKSQQDYTLLTQEQIQELNEQPVNFTFKQAIEEYHLDQHLDKIKIISETASKEYAIESILNKLDETWSNVEFTLAQYQNSDCYILKSLDDIMQLLDDNINLVQSMAGAGQFKAFF